MTTAQIMKRVATGAMAGVCAAFTLYLVSQGAWTTLLVWLGTSALGAAITFFAGMQVPMALYPAQIRFQRWCGRMKDSRRSRHCGFVLPVVQHLAPIPPGSNPFHYDYGRMGTDLVRGWVVMHPGFDSTETPLELGHVILVNVRSGQRILIRNLNDGPAVDDKLLKGELK